MNAALPVEVVRGRRTTRTQGSTLAPALAMDCDAVVIGSGLGGLTAALALARAGQRVVVLEQHYLPGGWAHSFTLEGYTFSPGVHYVGELERGANLRRLFEGLGVARRLRFRELAPDGYDHLLVGGERYDVPKGRERHVGRLKRRFPRAADGIQRYFDTCGKLVKELDAVASSLRFPHVLAVPFRAPTLTRWGFARLASLFDAAGIDDRLVRAFLSARCGNHGLAPHEASLAAHAMMISHYMEGAYYPVGGSKRIPAAFLRELRARRGEIHLRTRVKQILIEDGRAAGVELQDGRRVLAPRVISNADAALTYETLVPAPYARRQKRRASRMRPSVSSIALFAAADMDLAALGYDSGNYWWYRHDDVGGVYARMERAIPDELEGLFVAISSLKDPGLASKGHHTLEMFSFVPYDAFARWRGTATGARPVEYESFKRTLVERMLRAAEEVIPGLRANLAFCELGTPLTNDFYCASWRGACYGIAKTPWQVGPFAFATRSPIPGLALCGASTLSHGVAGACFSGLVAARDVLGLEDPMELLGPADGSLVVEPAEGSGERAARAAGWR
jgi:phytoene dehydrogenase-like protein